MHTHEHTHTHTHTQTHKRRCKHTRTHTHTCTHTHTQRIHLHACDPYSTVKQRRTPWARMHTHHTAQRCQHKTRQVSAGVCEHLGGYERPA